MCGITGMIRTGGSVDAALLDRMTDSLAHRGPDGRGVHIGDGFGFGHRRLAIIDLSTGAQRKPEYLALNPNGRIPVIIDHDAGDFAVIQSESFRSNYQYLRRFGKLTLRRERVIGQGVSKLTTRIAF